jgi:hypothetical protein
MEDISHSKNEISCEELRAMLDGVDSVGDLSPENYALVLLHIAECSSCQQEVSSSPKYQKIFGLGTDSEENVQH